MPADDRYVSVQVREKPRIQMKEITKKTSAIKMY
jgi:hypothetical protein